MWEKGTFFVCKTFPGRGQNMVRTKKCMFFLAQKFGFQPENPFFHMETCFFALKPG